MCRTLSMFALVTFTTLSAAESPSINVPLRAERHVVMAEYDRISGSDVRSRQHYCSDLAPSMKADLWTLHLAMYLESHPELTATQQSVIHQALGLIAVGVFDRRPATAALEADLLAKIKTNFPNAVARKIFTQLGREANEGGGGRGPRVKADAPSCTCSVESDYCDQVTNPDFRCVAVGARECTPACCCGTFWLYTCDGVCG